MTKVLYAPETRRPSGHPSTKTVRYSLIVPHYDDVARLDRLLHSVPTRRADIEILVVDDCSPDQRGLDALKRCWPGIRWLTTARNAGAGAARNVGLAAAQGDYLVFADSDDQFLPGAFDTFDEYVTPELDLIYFMAEARHDVDGAPSSGTDWLKPYYRAYLTAPSDHALKRLKLSHQAPWGKVYSRAFVQAVGTRFDEIRFGNDSFFCVVSALQATRVRVVPVTVYIYHRRPGSLTANRSSGAFLVRVQTQVRLARAQKALGLEHEYFMTKTGLMATALLRYGPVTAWKAWGLMRHSDMGAFELRKVLNPHSWLHLMRNLVTVRAEAKKAAEDARHKALASQDRVPPPPR